MNKRFFLTVHLLFLYSFLLFPGNFPLSDHNTNNSLVLFILEKDLSVSQTGNIGKLSLEGDRSIDLNFGREMWEVRYFSLPSGTYDAVIPQLEKILEIRKSYPLVVKNRSIVLSPVKAIVFQNDDGSVYTSLKNIDEEDRQKAAADLAGYINFSSWTGRDFLGFGSIKPSLEDNQNKHELILLSEPSGSEIYLDDVYVGLTPQTFLIDESKHQLRFKLDSYVDNVRYISVERPVKLDVVLEKTEIFEDKIFYRTLIAPFYSKDGGDDPMSRLLADTLVPVLEEDLRLELITGDIEWKQYADIIKPDFSKPELSEIDLIATGLYIRGESNLTVLASLYDVRSETIKAGITWTGPINLDIFDAVDEISLAFLQEVDRVLPEAGKVLINTNSINYNGLTPIDARMEVKRFIELRNEKRNILTLITGISGLFVNLKAHDDGAPSDKDIYTSHDPPFIPLVLDYEKYISEYFSIGVGLKYFSPDIIMGSTDSSDSDMYNPSIISLSVDGRIVVRGLVSDLIIGLGPIVRVVTGASVSWEDGGTWEDDIGAVITVGLQWSAGFRLFQNKRISKTPYFLYFGFNNTFPQMFFEPGGSNFGLSSSGISILVGGGILF